MDNLFIAASPSSPEVDFRFNDRELSLKGESYPENAAQFWGNIISTLKQFLDQDNAPLSTLTMDVSLTYFNSSSTKMLFSLFSVLDEKAASGTKVILNWCHDEDDDTIFEFGQELSEDFPNLVFNDLILNDEH